MKLKNLTPVQVQKLKHDLARLAVVLNTTKDAVSVSDDDPVIWAMGLHSLQAEMESLRVHAEEYLQPASKQPGELFDNVVQLPVTR